MPTYIHNQQDFGCRFIGDAVVGGPAVTAYAPLRLEAGAVSEVILAWTGDDLNVVSVQGLPASWYTLGASPAGPQVPSITERILVLHPPYGQELAPTGDTDFVVTFASAGGAERRVLARLTLLPPLASQGGSRYLDYLPALFREGDPYMGRMLLIFQSILDPLEGLVDAADLSSSPDLAPERFLPWLARWVGTGTPMAGGATTAARRAIARAPGLARWNGTRRALREHLQDATGAGVLMAENTDGMRLGQDAALGVSTLMGTAVPHTLSVTLVPPAGHAVDLERAERTLTAQKPAWIDCTVRVAAAPGGAANA